MALLRRFLKPGLIVCALIFVWSCGNDADVIDPGSSSLGVGSLTGTVKGSGALLENATIKTVPPTIETQTNALGEFTLNGLQPQSLTVSVTATGFTSQSRLATVVAGRTYSLDFDLVAGTALGHLRGTVTDGDLPLQNVSIATTPPSFSVITLGDGLYDFTNVAPGVYRIDASRRGFWPATIYSEALPGQTTIGNIGLGRRNDAVIAGLVRDVAGNPVANAVVTLFWDAEAESVTTSSDGSFRFDRFSTSVGSLPTGFYVVAASAVNYFSGSRSFEAFGGIEVDGTVILNLSSVTPPVPGAIAGIVWTEDTVPISGATVILDPVSPTPSTTTSAADGRYFFTDVATGTHTVTVSHPDYVGDTKAVDVGTNVTADQSFSLKEVP